jgi:hypothetical protein
MSGSEREQRKAIDQDTKDLARLYDGKEAEEELSIREVCRNCGECEKDSRL